MVPGQGSQKSMQPEPHPGSKLALLRCFINFIACTEMFGFPVSHGPGLMLSLLWSILIDLVDLTRMRAVLQACTWIANCPPPRWHQLDRGVHQCKMLILLELVVWQCPHGAYYIRRLGPGLEAESSSCTTLMCCTTDLGTVSDTRQRCVLLEHFSSHNMPRYESCCFGIPSAPGPEPAPAPATTAVYRFDRRHP